MSQYPKPDAPPPYGVNPPPYGGNPPHHDYPPTAGHPYPQPMTSQPVGVATVVVVGTTTTGAPLGINPTQVTCPSCRTPVLTRVTHESSTKTHLWALVLCLIGCWPCCLIPYCMDSCQSSNHHCPHCGAFLGRVG